MLRHRTWSLFSSLALLAIVGGIFALPEVQNPLRAQGSPVPIQPPVIDCVKGCGYIRETVDPVEKLQISLGTMETDPAVVDAHSYRACEYCRRRRHPLGSRRRCFMFRLKGGVSCSILAPARDHSSASGRVRIHAILECPLSPVTHEMPYVQEEIIDESCGLDPA